MTGHARALLSVFKLTAVAGIAITAAACSVFPDPIVGQGGRSTASMNGLLTFTDVQMADAALMQALQASPPGVTTNWANPQTGNSGAFMMLQNYMDAQGRPCRGYQELVRVRDGAQEGYTTSACRDQLGQWHRLEAL